MSTTTTTDGHDLRRLREEAGLTRAQLAALADCSLTALGNIEQGAVPKRSRVLEAALATIAAHHPSTQRTQGDDPGLAKTVDEATGNGSESTS